jgi:hypothetical protein
MAATAKPTKKVPAGKPSKKVVPAKPAKKVAATEPANGDVSLAEIAAEVNVSASTARRKLRDSDIPREGGRWNFAKKDVERVKKALAAG